MIEQTYQIHLFYPMLFLLLLAIVITIGIVCVKNKDNNLFGNIFNKHTDEHIDTTGKLSKAHTEVLTLPKEYEQEIHALESDVKEIKDNLLDLTKDINDKLSLLLKRVTKLEKDKHN